MATTKKEGTCECCGKQGTTGLSHAKWVCSMCANVRSNIKQRPETVLASLRELQPELFADEAAETVSREKFDHVVEMGRAMSESCNDIIKQLEDREKQIGQLHLERDALRQEIAGLHGRITDVTAERDAILTADIEEREQRRDLALKLAIGLLRGEVKGVGLDDIEQLRGV